MDRNSSNIKRVRGLFLPVKEGPAAASERIRGTSRKKKTTKKGRAVSASFLGIG